MNKNIDLLKDLLRPDNKYRFLFRLKVIQRLEFIQTLLRVFSLIAAILAVLGFTYYFGFNVKPSQFYLITSFIDISIALFIIRYVLKHILYKFKTVIKSYKGDTIAAIFILSNFILSLFDIFDIVPVANSHGYNHFEWYQIGTIALLFIFIYSSELSKSFNVIHHIPLKPAQVMTLTFISLIFLGAVALLLPKMHNGDLSFIDALFTSASASCVTGLSVIDVGTQLTFKGQIVLIFLMQLGGLNILTFAMFFAFLYTRSVGIGFNTILKDIFSLKQYSDIKRIIKKIIIISFSIELVGIFFLYFSWDNDLPFNSGGEKLFYSVFHAVSAFNNAGFSLFKNGLFENIVLKNYAVHYIIAILIILGGLGFTVLSEIFSATNIKNHLHTKTSFFSVNSKIVIYTTLALLVMGTGLFFILEYNNSLVRMSFAEKISIAFFQSVTTRTAGFNTVDFGHLLMPTYWLMILFMFIGASPGSTGGGIKTTTFMLLFKSGIANLRQQKNVNFFKKSIPYSHVDYAYALALLAAVFIFTATFLLSITETGKTFAALLFESVSAFATVGLSTGITASLSLAGKWIIITSMFIGRIGPLTLTLSFMSNPHKEKVYFAKSDILVG